MSDDAASPVRIEPPLEPNDVQLSAPPEVAAGPTGVRVALKHIREEMGLMHGLKVLRDVNQKDGFDCPGCAWPDPDGERSKLGEYCENGAKAVAEEATLKRVTPAFFAQHSIAQLSEQTDHWLGKQGRLTHPMVLRSEAEHYTPIDWAEAFALIAFELNRLDRPDEAIFYTSGRTSNEAAYLYQLFVRAFGTNNLPDCSNMCHESSGVGLSEVIGVGKGTVTLADFDEADLILVVGQNPGTNHPRMLGTLQQAKANGAQIIHINPLPEVGLKRFKHPQTPGGWIGNGAALADQFLQVRINGDVALLKGIMKALLEAEDRVPGSVLNLDFIRAKTQGFEAFAEDLRQADWGVIVEESGIGREQIYDVAHHVAGTERIIICWAMGLTQHENGVANVQACVNLLLMRGAIGQPGAGACPVRGHSNVQGDRTVGITPRPKPAFLDALAKTFGFEPPRNNGVDTVEAIKAMHSREAKVFIALGGNFLSASPDTRYTAEALQNCRLTVHVSTKLNRAHLVTGTQALILPCLGRTEEDVQQGKPQFVSVENSMGIVHTSEGTLPPASEHLLSEPVIVSRLAQATLGEREELFWKDWTANYDTVRDLIAHTVPGFKAYNQRVREPGGFYLPNAARDGVFNTDTGKAKFTVHPIPRYPLEKGQYVMMTIRSHDQYNTTIYGLDDRYRGIHGGRRVVLMHLEDMAEAGLDAQQVVDLISQYKGEERVGRAFRVVPYTIPRRCVATYFPEANVLVPIDATAAKSNTPASKSVVVSIREAV